MLHVCLDFTRVLSREFQGHNCLVKCFVLLFFHAKFSDQLQLHRHTLMFPAPKTVQESCHTLLTKWDMRPNLASAVWPGLWEQEPRGRNKPLSNGFGAIQSRLFEWSLAFHHCRIRETQSSSSGCRHCKCAWSMSNLKEFEGQHLHAFQCSESV